MWNTQFHVGGGEPLTKNSVSTCCTVNKEGRANRFLYWPLVPYSQPRFSLVTPPLSNKTCLRYVSSLTNCRCFYSSTDVSGTHLLLRELLIAADYVQYRTSFAVSHSCEILHGEFQTCFICDKMRGVGFAKRDLTFFGKHFKNKPRETQSK